MNIVDITELNRRLGSGAEAFVQEADAAYRARIENVARAIWTRRLESGVVLLTGPSGSGKTTSAQMLEAFLDSWDCETHTVSLDDYFAPFTPAQWQQVERGEMDFESPNRIDTAFLNEQLADIVACKPVRLPTYDFANSKRLFDGRVLHRKPGELVLFEGIHALNPEVITLPDDQVSRVYVSVRTRVSVNGELLHPSWIRLMRRLIRDRRGRGRSFAETVAMYENVERGEQLYIAPHKHRAQYELDSFQPYELGIYKPIFENGTEGCTLSDVPLPARTVLEASDGAPVSILSERSLIREFVG